MENLQENGNDNVIVQTHVQMYNKTKAGGELLWSRKAAVILRLI